MFASERWYDMDPVSIDCGCEFPLLGERDGRDFYWFGDDARNPCPCPQSKYKHLHFKSKWICPHAHSDRIGTATPNSIIVRVYDCVCVRVCASEGIVICICGREGKKGSRSETIIVNNPSTQSHRSFSVSNLKFIIVCLNYVHSVRCILYPCLVATSEFSSSSSFVYLAALHNGRTRNRVAKQWTHKLFLVFNANKLLCRAKPFFASHFIW